MKPRTTPVVITDGVGWPFGLLFFALALLSVVPLWLAPYPPLQDFPQHLAAIRVLHSYGDPGYGFADFFELHIGRTQYLAYYLLASVLSYVLPLPTASLLVVSVGMFALPYALAALLRGLGRDERQAVWVLPLSYNAHLVLGFVNFVAALPLMVYGLALAVRQRSAPSRSRAVGLSALLVLTFYMHVVPFGVLVLGLLLLAVQAHSIRAALRSLAPLLPSALLAALWVVRSPAGQATAHAAGVGQGPPGQKLQFRPEEAAITQLPRWLTDVFAGDWDLWLLRAWAVLLVGLCILALVPAARAQQPTPQVESTTRLRLWPLLPLCAAGYLWLPSGFDWIWPIAERFALLGAVLSPLLLPRLRRPIAHVAVALGIAVSALSIAGAAQSVRRFASEIGDVDGALAIIPPRQRVAGLIFDRGSREVAFSQFLHYVALYQARKGGVVMFTFADFPQSPFSFRSDARPPRVPPRWEWLPRLVMPTRDLRYYDYVLVRGGPGRIAKDTHFRQVFRSARWSVFKRVS